MASTPSNTYVLQSGGDLYLSSGPTGAVILKTGSVLLGEAGDNTSVTVNGSLSWPTSSGKTSTLQSLDSGLYNLAYTAPTGLVWKSGTDGLTGITILGYTGIYVDATSAGITLGITSYTLGQNMGVSGAVLGVTSGSLGLTGSYLFLDSGSTMTVGGTAAFNGGRLTLGGSHILINGSSITVQNHLDMSQKRIVNVADPVNAQDVVNKRYLEAISTGFQILNTASDAVAVDVTSVNYGWSAGTTFVSGQTYYVFSQSGTTLTMYNSSVTLVDGAYILLTGTHAEEAKRAGLYRITVSGSTTTLTNIYYHGQTYQAGSVVGVAGGASAGLAYAVQSDATVGTDNVVFAQASSVGQVRAGAGLVAPDALVFDVNPTNGITINSDAVGIYATNTFGYTAGAGVTVGRLCLNPSFVNTATTALTLVDDGAGNQTLRLDYDATHGLTYYSSEGSAYLGVTTNTNSIDFDGSGALKLAQLAGGTGTSGISITTNGQLLAVGDVAQGISVGPTGIKAVVSSAGGITFSDGTYGATGSIVMDRSIAGYGISASVNEGQYTVELNTSSSGFALPVGSGMTLTSTGTTASITAASTAELRLGQGTRTPIVLPVPSVGRGQIEYMDTIREYSFGVTCVAGNTAGTTLLGIGDTLHSVILPDNFSGTVFVEAFFVASVLDTDILNGTGGGSALSFYSSTLKFAVQYLTGAAKASSASNPLIYQGVTGLGVTVSLTSNNTTGLPVIDFAVSAHSTEDYVWRGYARVVYVTNDWPNTNPLGGGV